jgi:hypothetical protein
LSIEKKYRIGGLIEDCLLANSISRISTKFLLIDPAGLWMGPKKLVILADIINERRTIEEEASMLYLVTAAQG